MDKCPRFNSGTAVLHCHVGVEDTKREVLCHGSKAWVGTKLASQSSTDELKDGVSIANVHVRRDLRQPAEGDLHDQLPS